MAACECLAGCAFFNDRMKEKPATAEIFKKNYRLGGNNAECAHHQVKVVLGKELVPGDLFPTQNDRARSIIAGAKR